MEKNVTLESFYCEKNLSQYISSMLFDSGEEIARGIFSYEGEILEISLRVCGEVRVRYDGEVYRTPSEFPDDLIELIEKRPYDWDVYAPSGEDNDDTGEDIYVDANNWFEYLFDGDGDVYEEDLSKATSQMILNDMSYIARRYFGYNKKGEKI